MNIFSRIHIQKKWFIFLNPFEFLPKETFASRLLTMSKAQKPILSLITVNYRNSKHIRNLSDSLVRYPPLVEWEWIVVDNASAHNDGQRLEEILKDIPQAHIIKLHHNLGFGGANKEGLQFSHGEIIAFINPDIEVQKDCFSELLPVLKNENIGILTPQLQTKEGKYLEHTWRFPTVWELMARRLFRHQSTPKIPTQIHSVAWAQGSFLIMKKSLFLSLGGFDDRFFLFFEDTDLCRRTWESGKKVVQIPTAKAIHSEHRLSGKDIFRSLLRKTFWIHVVSMIRYFWKWRGKPLPDIF